MSALWAVALIMLLSGAAKLRSREDVGAVFTRLKVPRPLAAPWLARAFPWLELLLGAALLLPFPALRPLTGAAAANIDITEKLADAFPLFLVIVVGLAIVLLLVAFRSLLVPLTAVLGFLLTIAAAFGATTVTDLVVEEVRPPASVTVRPTWKVPDAV